MGDSNKSFDEIIEGVLYPPSLGPRRSDIIRSILLFHHLNPPPSESFSSYSPGPSYRITVHTHTYAEVKGVDSSPFNSVC